MNPSMGKEEHQSLTDKEQDPLIRVLSKIVILIVKALAVLMVVVILWAFVDVVIHLYQQSFATFTSIFNIENLFSTLGAFLAVLIAVEIFLNIIFYLKEDVIHVPLVVATALTAISRKVIIVDYTPGSTETLYATAGLIFAVGITYWLVTKK